MFFSYVLDDGSYLSERTGCLHPDDVDRNTLEDTPEGLITKANREGATLWMYLGSLAGGGTHYIGYPTLSLH